MAKSKTGDKKNAGKHAAPKKTAPRKTAKEGFGNNPVRIIVENPIKIVVELVIRDLREPSAEEANMLGGEDKPKIAYEFKGEKISVLSLEIQGKKVSSPGSSGSVTLDFIPLSGFITVAAKATGGAPDSNGSLQLKFQQKELFSPAEEFNFSGSIGSINTKAKIS